MCFARDMSKDAICLRRDMPRGARREGTEERALRALCFMTADLVIALAGGRALFKIGTF